MKIVHVNKLYSCIGGIENYVYNLTRDLAYKYRADTTVLASSRKMRTEVTCHERLKIIQLASTPKILRMPVSPLLYTYLSKFTDFDIIHFHHPFPLAELASLALKFKGKIVVTWHSDIIHQKMALKFYSPFIHKFLSRADAICTTSHNYLYSSDFLGPYKQKCSVIPLGVRY